jgi:hypothetical protein
VANDTQCPDLTFGTMNLPPSGPATNLFNKFGLAFGSSGLPSVTTPHSNGQNYQNSNAEVMGILLDRITFGNGSATVNVNHSRNTQQTVFLHATEVSDTVSPGIGSDGVYRDPWGNPYIITIDMDGDNKCRDGFYRQFKVSGNPGGTPGSGQNGLTCATGNSDNFEANTTIMVWSLGPDGKADSNTSASQGVNKDNVRSW